MLKQNTLSLSGYSFLLLILLTAGCATRPTPVASSPTTVAPNLPVEGTRQIERVEPISVAPACDCDAVKAAEELALKREESLRKLRLANEWHLQHKYQSSMQAYEAVLVDNVSTLVDAYALWGIVALYLDRNNPDYDREKARTVVQVLENRASQSGGEGSEEARLLRFAVQTMMIADVSKDNVVAENRRLSTELAQREEAIQRLRELTVGR